MDDQVDRKTEQELRGYLSERLDRVPVSSTPRFTRPSAGWLSRAATVPIVMVLMVAAIAGGVALGDWREQQRAGSQPPSASPMASASAIPSASYGIVVAQRGSQGGLELVIRSETDARPIVTLGSFSAMPSVAGRTLAVSPDGRRLAFWTDNQGANSVQLWDAATPNRTTTLLTSPSGETGTGVLWSSDGEGLLLSFVSVARQPRTNPPPPPDDTAETVLRTLEIASGNLTQVFRAKRGGLEGSVAPVAWNRERKTIGAVEVGGGGFAIAYLLIRDGDVSRTVFDRALSSVRSVAGSSDALWVVAVAGDSRIVTWSVSNPGRVTELQPLGASVHFGWLPRSTRVIVRQGAGVQDAKLFLWDVATDDRTEAGSSRYLAVPRADGSALYVTDERGSTSVLEIASGAREPLANMPTYVVQGQVFPEGVPVVGVILR